MQKREVTKKQLAVIILLSIGMLAAAALLNQFFPAGSKQTKETLKQTAVTPKVTALPSLSPTQKPTPTPDPTKKVATFFQGPKAYEGRREWSGKWGKEFYVAPLVLLDAVFAAWQIFIRHFLSMKVRRLTCISMQKK